MWQVRQDCAKRSAQCRLREGEECLSTSEWFHLGCTELDRLPGKDIEWVCPKCRPRRPGKRRKLNAVASARSVCIPGSSDVGPGLKCCNRIQLKTLGSGAEA